MPVTKTAKRALRSSKKKGAVNAVIINKLETAVRLAKRSKTLAKIQAAVTLVDRAAKKRVIHKNKAARIKSTLAKLLSKGKKSHSKTSKK